MFAVALLFALSAVSSPPASTAPRNCECLQKPLSRISPVVPPEPDAWIAEDKAKHTGVSFALTAFGYGGARVIGISHATATPLAAIGGFAFGIAKEINDKRTGRDFSFRDLVADAVGVALGTILASHTR